jgi:hypothetical protein
LSLPAGLDPAVSWIQMPVTGVPALGAAYGQIYGELDLNVTSEATSTYMILTRGDKAVAWAEIKSGSKPRIGVGGSLAAIPITGSADALGPAAIGIETSPGIYSHLELILDLAAKTVKLKLDGAEVASLSYTVEGIDDVDGLRIWADGAVILDQVALLSGLFTPPPAKPKFVRGDSNDDQKMDISDPIHLLSYKFLGQAEPSCLDAADASDDGQVDQTDAVNILTYLFINSQIPLPAPFGGSDFTPAACGEDPSGDDGLGCGGTSYCP